MKQYIHWYDSEESAWEFVLEHIKIMQTTGAIDTHTIGVEYYSGKYWVVLKRK